MKKSKQAMPSRRIFGRYHSNAWLCLSYIFLYLSMVCRSAYARVLDTHEAAIGEWDVTLRGGPFFDPSRVFPSIKPTITTTITTTTTTVKNGIISVKSSDRNYQKGDTHQQPKPRKRRRGEKGQQQDQTKPLWLRWGQKCWGTKLDCSLSLCQDGTFVLVPKKATITTEKNKNRRVEEKQVLPIRGDWRIMKNPYCVTDRFYDQLQLKSYPRVEMKHATRRSRGGSSGVATTTEEAPARQVQMSFSCRLCGRFTYRDEGETRAGGVSSSSSSVASTSLKKLNEKLTLPIRMTHGTMVWKEEVNAKRNRITSRQWFRPVIATFKASRILDEPIHEGWQDRDYFGY